MRSLETSRLITPTPNSSGNMILDSRHQGIFTTSSNQVHAGVRASPQPLANLRAELTCRRRDGLLDMSHLLRPVDSTPDQQGQGDTTLD